MDKKDEYPELEAAEWFALLQEPELSEERLLAWERWMSASTDNMKAFSQYQKVYSRLDQLGDVPLPKEEELEADGYDGSVSVNEWMERQKQPAVAEVVRLPARKRKIRWMPIGAAAAVLLAALVTIFIPQGAVMPEVQVFETATAEHRTVELSDGSNIVLGAESSVIVSYTGQQRNIALTRGEALFTVTKDRSRPFVVLAGNGSSTVLGTVFNVRRYTGRTQVTVAEGRVQVESHAGNQESQTDAISQTVVAAGEQINYLKDGQQTDVISIDAEMATAWQNGYQRYRNAPLQYVIDDINRYSEKELILVGSKASELQFTGTVYHDQIDKWITGVVDVFGLEVTEVDDRATIIRKR